MLELEGEQKKCQNVFKLGGRALKSVKISCLSLNSINSKGYLLLLNAVKHSGLRYCLQTKKINRAFYL